MTGESYQQQKFYETSIATIRFLVINFCPSVRHISRQQNNNSMTATSRINMPTTITTVDSAAFNSDPVFVDVFVVVFVKFFIYRTFLQFARICALMFD
jgi:hypothetical protein